MSSQRKLLNFIDLSKKNEINVGTLKDLVSSLVDQMM